MNLRLALFHWRKADILELSVDKNTFDSPKKVDEKRKKGIQLAKVTRVAIL